MGEEQRIETGKPVEVGDLLRLKRAEQPSPEFWSQFERELQRRTLQAAFQPRPLWRRAAAGALLHWKGFATTTAAAAAACVGAILLLGTPEESGPSAPLVAESGASAILGEASPPHLPAPAVLTVETPHAVAAADAPDASVVVVARSDVPFENARQTFAVREIVQHAGEESFQRVAATQAISAEPPERTHFVSAALKPAALLGTAQPGGYY